MSRGWRPSARLCSANFMSSPMNITLRHMRLAIKLIYALCKGHSLLALCFLVLVVSLTMPIFAMLAPLHRGSRDSERLVTSIMLVKQSPQQTSTHANPTYYPAWLCHKQKREQVTKARIGGAPGCCPITSELILPSAKKYKQFEQVSRGFGIPS